LIEAMRRVALSKGFPGTTVDEICERAGVAKGSFYYHFQGKDDLGAAALSAYFEDLMAALAGGEWGGVADPVERLGAFIAHVADVCAGPVMEHGCLMGSFALDLSESSPQIRQQLSTMFSTLRHVVAGLIAEAARHRGRDLDAERLANQFLALIEGSIVLAKAHDDPAIPRQNVEMFAVVIASLLSG
jgi:TetR/AcrR family transcriptional repressor of nem operon